MSYQETITEPEEQPHEGSLWRWIGIFVVITAILGFMRWWTAAPSLIGDAMAFSGMVLGGLVMIQSQRDFRAAGLERVIE